MSRAVPDEAVVCERVGDCESLKRSCASGACDAKRVRCAPIADGRHPKWMKICTASGEEDAKHER